MDHKEDALEAAKALVLETAPEAKIVAADVSDESQVQKYVDATVDEFGTIDGFFNNADIEGRQNLTEDFGADEFTKMVSVNLNGVFYGMAAVLKVMREQGYGSVLTSASVGGLGGRLLPVR